MTDNIIMVRGGGDLASGVVYRLHRCGYRVLILESDKPSSIRRMVSFSEAVYDGEAFVEGVLCQKIQEYSQCEKIWEAEEIPLLVDPVGATAYAHPPAVLVDAIIAKRNLGTTKAMAPLTIALGPGFVAGEDVDFVVETRRGHTLGAIIEDGEAIPNTGIPGMIGGYARERVIHSPAAGIMKNISRIADVVKKDQILGYVGQVPVKATIPGVLRGLIRDGYNVYEGMKIADIDPRIEEKENCYTISDKARCISGSVVEIVMSKGVLP